MGMSGLLIGPRLSIAKFRIGQTIARSAHERPENPLRAAARPGIEHSVIGSGDIFRGAFTGGLCTLSRRRLNRRQRPLAECPAPVFAQLRELRLTVQQSVAR